ncbi:MAG: acyl carrier protein [Chloroflexi bacterium 44-23]|nr:MAG: acyl carrier protein [Chloroflexi bacterium 44-23]
MEIQEKIKKFIADNILFSENGYPYAVSDSFLEKGVVDSMNIMEIVAFVEDEFSISVDDLEIVPANFDSVKNVTEFVERKTLN